MACKSLDLIARTKPPCTGVDTNVTTVAVGETAYRIRFWLIGAPIGIGECHFSVHLRPHIGPFRGVIAERGPCVL